MATKPDRRITYEDYLHFPDGERWEVIDGEAYVVPSPNEHHQYVAGEIFRQVANYLKTHGGGRVYMAPFDAVLDREGDIVQPDIVFIADEHMDVLTEANVWGTPSWVVEVMSDPRRDRTLKLPRYERAGIPEYWIVDPREDLVEVYRLEAGAYGEAVIARPPDRLSPLRPVVLAIDLSEVFAR